MLADISNVDKKLDRTAKIAKSGDKVGIATMDVLKRVKAALEDGKPVRSVTLSENDLELIKDLQLITQKPFLFVGNIDERTAGSGSEMKNPHYLRLLEYAQKVGAQAIPICAKVEAEVQELDASERKAFLTDLGIEQSGLDKLIAAAYRLLGLSTYFTAGVQEVRAWTIQTGWKAPQAAGVIHSDFERGFICVETFAYDDIVRLGSEAKVKEAGLLRTEGREYIVKDGDVLHFRFNV